MNNTPKIGEIAQGQSLGYKTKCKYIYKSCPDCGQRRWVKEYYIRKHGSPIRCKSCMNKINGETRKAKRNPNKHRAKNSGYLVVSVPPNHTLYPMADKNGLVFEHRFIMATHLNRLLSRTEIVHHKNGVRSDNRIENLEISTANKHGLQNRMCSKCHLQKEIRLLKWQIKEQSNQIKELTTKLMGIS